MLPERLSRLVASIPCWSCGSSHPRRAPSPPVPTLPRCTPRCQTLPHDQFVICGRGDAGVPVVCDLELIAPTRVPNSAEESALFIAEDGSWPWDRQEAGRALVISPGHKSPTRPYR